MAESTAAGVLCRMRYWVAVLLVVCVVSLHLHGALGKRKPNIIIFFVDDVSGSLSNECLGCDLLSRQVEMMLRKSVKYKC